MILFPTEIKMWPYNNYLMLRAGPSRYVLRTEDLQSRGIYYIYYLLSLLGEQSFYCGLQEGMYYMYIHGWILLA